MIFSVFKGDSFICWFVYINLYDCPFRKYDFGWLTRILPTKTQNGWSKCCALAVWALLLFFPSSRFSKASRVGVSWTSSDMTCFLNPTRWQFLTDKTWNIPLLFDLMRQVEIIGVRQFPNMSLNICFSIARKITVHIGKDLTQQQSTSMKKYLNYLHHQLRRMKNMKEISWEISGHFLSDGSGTDGQKTYIVEGHFCSINHFGGRVGCAY